MKIYLHLPAATVERVFDPKDLARLESAGHALHYAGEKATPAAWADHAADAPIIITGWGTPPISDEQLDRAPKLRALVHSAGSTKYLLPPSFWSRDIRLATANEALAIGVAEMTLCLIIAALKGIFPCSAHTRAGYWYAERSRVGGFTVRELYDVTIGIIGASKAGRHVIRLLRNFQAKVLVSDPHLTPEQAVELGVEKVELGELMSRADVVSLHAPALESTRRMLGREQFRAMRDEAVFINTARGMIVDEQALVDELRSGRIFAIIDVTYPEPPPADHPFRSLPNCVLLPHIAGNVTNGCRRQGRSVVDQIDEFTRGQPMHGEVTAEQFRIMA